MESGHERSSYVQVVIGNRNFSTGKLVIVKVDREYTFIHTYADKAYKIACEKLGLNPDECSLLSYSYLGPDVTFII